MTRPASLIIYEPPDYDRAWDFQRRLVPQRLADQVPDTLILAEHNPVYTIGRSGREAHCKARDGGLSGLGVPVRRVERGGSVTYHGPGQIVGYPILNLRSYCSGPKTYMRLLEDVLIQVLSDWGICGRRRDKLPGVWVGEDPGEKIAAMGVRLYKGVTMHGFALNVTVDLEPFGHITPCGIPDCRVTSMAAILGRSLDQCMVRSQVALAFADVFSLSWIDHHIVHAFSSLAPLDNAHGKADGGSPMPEKHPHGLAPCLGIHSGELRKEKASCE